MRFGIHLPQIGRAASAKAIRAVAQLAEEHGLDDVWVSDHQVIPSKGSGLPAYLFDPLTALTWAGAVTERVGLGTSVLVVPLYPAALLANTLASLDQLSGGRVILGAGVGWLEAEFRAAGVPMSERGARMDEALDVLRACWSEDPIHFEGRWLELQDVRMQPQPARPIPVWIGGSGERAYRRAVEKGDGFHAVRRDPEAMIGEAINGGTLRPDGRVLVTHLGAGLADVVFGDALACRRAVEDRVGIAGNERGLRLNIHGIHRAIVEVIERVAVGGPDGHHASVH